MIYLTVYEDEEGQAQAHAGITPEDFKTDVLADCEVGPFRILYAATIDGRIVKDAAAIEDNDIDLTEIFNP